MKLLFIIGSGAVGKMTVGQELMKRTKLRLFHNHMSIELVLEVLGKHDTQMIKDVREGEIPFENYLGLDNTEISAQEVAEIIQQRFGFE